MYTSADSSSNCLQSNLSKYEKYKCSATVCVVVHYRFLLRLGTICSLLIWMHVFCRPGVYYDNVESLFGLKCHFA